MTDFLNLHGPPGTGKTSIAVAIFERLADRLSSERVGYVSYTRAAAHEARDRVAAALHVRPEAAARTFPFVGTIHSLAYHLLGRPRMVDGTAFRTFCEEVHLAPPTGASFPNPEDAGAYWWDAYSREEALIFQKALATARHRMVPIEQAMPTVPIGRSDITPARLSRLAARYHEWKQEQRLLDFEDLLDEGSRLPLPIDALIVDEAQDNSKLLWSVVDAWSTRLKMLVSAGDPGQAIYIFNGGDPDLFANRPGEWRTLDKSYRLDEASARYAERTLSVGWKDDRFVGTWHGEGGEPRDGTTFYLARTWALLEYVRTDLEARGEPYLELRGRAPLQTQAADAYRVIVALESGQVVPRAALQAVGKAIKLSRLPAELRSRASEMMKERGDGEVGASTAAYFFGPLDQLRNLVDHADYFRRVEAKYGLRGLMATPKTALGTLHSAKGKEADTVHLVSSWATLPSRSLLDSGGRKSEACVAYVGVSRHRSELHFLEVPEGTRFPFPGRWA